jgi:hypothetical protein
MPRSSNPTLSPARRVQQLLEHFDAGDDRLARVRKPDDFHFLADLTYTLLDTPVTTVPRP